MNRELEDIARHVVAAWEAWCDADGWDNKEYDRLAARLSELAQALDAVKKLREADEWKSAAADVGVASPGAMQQAKHMAAAALEALDLDYEHTSPKDIRDAIEKLKKYVDGG